MRKYRIVETIYPSNKREYVIQSKKHWYGRWRQVDIVVQSSGYICKSRMKFDSYEIAEHVKDWLKSSISIYKGYHIYPVFRFNTQGELLNDINFIYTYLDIDYVANFCGTFPYKTIEQIRNIIDSKFTENKIIKKIYY